jgi:hypothetical protein
MLQKAGGARAKGRHSRDSGTVSKRQLVFAPVDFGKALGLEQMLDLIIKPKHREVGVLKDELEVRTVNLNTTKHVHILKQRAL